MWWCKVGLGWDREGVRTVVINGRGDGLQVVNLHSISTMYYVLCTALVDEHGVHEECIQK